MVSTAQFKPEARELADRSGVLLWDREALETQLRGENAPREHSDEAPAQTLA